MTLNKQGCPICGFTDITVVDEFHCTTFEICECCGSEAGFAYDQHSTSAQLAKVRREWLVDKQCECWGDKDSIPHNWDPQQQMALAGIEYP